MENIPLFISYAHEDELLCTELEKHLKLLKSQGSIIIWFDRNISVGKEREREIDIHLNSAKIILLLISADFLASEYCYGIEMRQAMKRHTSGEACVIPIILRPVDWQDAPFGMLQALPTDAKPVKSSHWYTMDDAFVNIVKGIKEVIEGFSKRFNDIELYSGTIQTSKEANYRSPHTRAKPELFIYRDTTGALLFHDKGKALAAYDAAIRLDPNNALFHKGKADILLDLMRLDESLDSYNQAIELMPNNPHLYQNKGNVLSRMHLYEKALIAYDQAISLDSNNTYFYQNKLDSLAYLSQYEEAVKACNQIIRLDPNDAYGYERKASCLLLLECYEEALDVYDQLLGFDLKETSSYDQTLQPGLKKATYYELKAKLLLQLKRYEEALAAYNQALSCDPSDYVKSTIYEQKAKLLKQFGSYEQALATYDQALLLDLPTSSFDPSDCSSREGIYWQKAELLKQLKRYDEALVVYDRALSLDPPDSKYRVFEQKVALLKLLERYDEALIVYDNALLFDLPDYSKNGMCKKEICEQKAELLEQLGRYEEAIVAYDKAFRKLFGNLPPAEIREHEEISRQKKNELLKLLKRQKRR